MIKKSIIFALILMGLYSIFFHYALNNPDKKTIQSQWQENLIKAQEFLYDTSGFDKVILGSSLSTLIIVDSLADDFYNLAMSGMTVMDGLEILKNKKEKPKFLFIESNFYMKPLNKDFQKTIFTPFNYYSKKNIPLLRDKIKPIPLAAQSCVNLVKKLQKNDNSNLDEENKHNDVVTDPELKNQLVEIQINNINTLADSAEVYSALLAISDYLTGLQNQGVQIYIYEMPVDEAIMSNQTYINLNNIFREYLNDKYIKYIDFPSGIDWPTSDGVHLAPSGAIRYTTFFRDHLQNLGIF